MLAACGFVPSVLTMAAALFVILIGVVIYMPKGLPVGRKDAKFSEVFSKDRNINWLSAARLFLFGAIETARNLRPRVRKMRRAAVPDAYISLYRELHAKIVVEPPAQPAATAASSSTSTRRAKAPRRWGSGRMRAPGESKYS